MKTKASLTIDDFAKPSDNLYEDKLLSLMDSFEVEPTINKYWLIKKELSTYEPKGMLKNFIDLYKSNVLFDYEKRWKKND